MERPLTFSFVSGVGATAGTSRGTAAKPALPLKGRRMFLQLQGYTAAARLEQDLLLLGGVSNFPHQNNLLKHLGHMILSCAPYMNIGYLFTKYL